MKTIKFIWVAPMLLLLITSCDPNRNNAKLKDSTDTTSVNKGGGPAIRDTATVSADEKRTKMDSMKGDTTAKGNASPTGH